MSTLYSYSDGDLLNNRHTYFYTAFQGAPFITAWATSRAEAIAQITDQPGSDRAAPSRSSAEHLFAALGEQVSGSVRDTAMAKVALLIRRFEVSKRVFDAYDEQLRPLRAEQFHDLANYIAFGELLETAYREQATLPALNALLKCLDIVVAHRSNVPSDYAHRAAVLIERERKHVLHLAARVDVKLQ